MEFNNQEYMAKNDENKINQWAVQPLMTRQKSKREGLDEQIDIIS